MRHCLTNDADRFGHIERTFRLRTRVAGGPVSGEFIYPATEIFGLRVEYAWVYDDNGSLRSPIFQTAQAARDWMGDASSSFVVQTKIEQPTR